MRILLVFAVLLHGVGAQAMSRNWTFQDWNVHVEAYSTGEDWRVYCTAWTGGDGDPTLRIQLSNGDGGPPYFYPAPVLSETAPRGYGTSMYDQQPVTFQFDQLWATPGSVRAWVNDEGLHSATARASDAESLGMLRAMRQASSLWVTSGNTLVYVASLNGFTAAYGKMVDECGFSTAGVVG